MEKVEEIYFEEGVLIIKVNDVYYRQIVRGVPAYIEWEVVGKK